jgi:hypothetical protein
MLLTSSGKSTAVNEFRFGYNQFINAIELQRFHPNVVAEIGGWREGKPFPDIYAFPVLARRLRIRRRVALHRPEQDFPVDGADLLTRSKHGMRLALKSPPRSV